MTVQPLPQRLSGGPFPGVCCSDLPGSVRLVGRSENPRAAEGSVLVSPSLRSVSKALRRSGIGHFHEVRTAGSLLIQI
jgi:hypothetical protein